ncbi:Dyp-type peroxidase [Pseudoalteromonas denitrificans]|uniref:Putative iron-dependent peroxidase n=1 Tax=Pseudoalteromonas denitrificans DSM 6059 TaxID=1123010 RepID=A0A1I1JC36_9GAMM|nr:Dyp-type peroxidase [Pseudoalteromonas denitrificans]SFC46104.1 putative iron-dependent peroxidase [Pseudoalteromonas denitrificans DSM 6059]
MPQAQSGVCAEANLHGLYLFFNVLDGHDTSIRDKLGQITSLQDDYSDQFSEAMLSSMVAIGAQYWPHLYPKTIPKGLKSFPNISHSDHEMPSQPFDVFIQIRSDRLDVIHLFASNILTLFSSDVELVEQIKCFRFLDGRDFNGFIYGADTPRGRSKMTTALVSPHDDLEFSQGSYIHVQRYRHNIIEWQKLSITEQEQIMGRSRLDNDLIMPLNASSHANRVELKSQDGHPLLLHQGMPYGDMHEQGMLLVTCSNDGDAFEVLNKARLGNKGVYDAWLDYTQAEMGASFFAPSVNFLSSLKD